MTVFCVIWMTCQVITSEVLRRCIQGESETQETSLSPTDAKLAVRTQRAIDKRQRVAEMRQERLAHQRLEKEEQLRQEEVDKEREQQRLEEEELHRFQSIFNKTKINSKN